MPWGSAPASSIPRWKERSLRAGFSRAIFTPRTYGLLGEHRGRPLLLLGEGLAQLLLLLLWEVGRDDLEVVGLQLVYDPLRGVGPAGQGKQRGGTRRHLLTNLPDEVVVDAHVCHRPRKCSHARTDRRAEEGYEEDQPEQEAPEGSTHRSSAGRAGQLAGLGLLVAFRPGDHSRVLEGDHLSLL